MDHLAEFDWASQGKNDPLTGIEIPAALLPSLNRHRENLARLVLSLQSLGLDEKQIESSVSVIIASYKDELISAIKAIVR